jgi:hypothetical protein
MIKQPIWTRQRNLQDINDQNLIDMRATFKGLATELDNDDWRAAAISADALITQVVRQKEIDRELEDVNEIVAAWDRINERMEQIESTLIAEGIGT